ncbi:MAG: hypothetical protein ACRDPA_11230, partial [Solirubrobacteraceae bacterium]
MTDTSLHLTLTSSADGEGQPSSPVDLADLDLKGASLADLTIKLSIAATPDSFPSWLIAAANAQSRPLSFDGVSVDLHHLDQNRLDLTGPAPVVAAFLDSVGLLVSTFGPEAPALFAPYLEQHPSRLARVKHLLLREVQDLYLYFGIALVVSFSAPGLAGKLGRADANLFATVILARALWR